MAGLVYGIQKRRCSTTPIYVAYCYDRDEDINTASYTAPLTPMEVEAAKASPAEVFEGWYIKDRFIENAPTCSLVKQVVGCVVAEEEPAAVLEWADYSDAHTESRTDHEEPSYTKDGFRALLSALSEQDPDENPTYYAEEDDN